MKKITDIEIERFVKDVVDKFVDEVSPSYSLDHKSVGKPNNVQITYVQLLDGFC